jgi:hypothetical protein
MILRLVLALFTITLFLTSSHSNTLQAKEYMFFSVDSFWLKKESVNPPLEMTGDIAAKKMKLIFDSEEIDIDPPQGELFYAKVKLNENRITFKKDYISFSTDMGKKNPLKGINEFDIKSSDIEFSNTGIVINSKKMDLTMDKVEFGLKNVSLACESDDDYSTQIDSLCLKNAYLKKLSFDGNEDNASLSIKGLNSTYNLELDFKLKDLIVSENNIEAQTYSISGKIINTNYILEQADFKCHKFSDQTTIDPEKLIGGCFEESISSIKNFKLKKKDLDANVYNANMNITEDHFTLISDNATFSSGETSKKDVTSIQDLSIDCYKVLEDQSNNKKINFERSLILEGCIKQANVTIEKVHVDEAKALQFLKNENFSRYEEVKNQSRKLFNFMNFKKVSIKSEKGNFILRAKAKFLFRVPVKITGNLVFGKESRVLSMSIDKASVLGIPSKKLALYLVKKFVANDDIQVNENTINIQF